MKIDKLEMKKNKFKKGDIVYSIDVNKHLIINVNKLIIESLFFNDLEKYNTYIYSYIGLENEVIRDHEIPETEEEIKKKEEEDIFSSINDERKPSMSISGSGVESSFCTKDELEDEIAKKLNQRIEQNKNLSIAAEKFRCPITGGKIIRIPKDSHILDGPTNYSVEGSKIVWKTYPRDWSPRPYHTTYKGKNYTFEYLGDGNWRELTLIEGVLGRGKYVDKIFYDSKDEKTCKEVEDFYEEQRIEKKKRDNKKKEINLNAVNFSAFKPVSSKLSLNELVEVKPMPLPTGTLHYISPPEREKMKVKIDGEEYEINVESFEKWDLKKVDSGFMFGTTLIEILK